MKVFSHLNHIQAYVWQQLSEAPHLKRHPWRTAVIANLVDHGVILQRTIVLRKAVINDRLLRFYTDIRSTKIKALPKNDSFSWLFYDNHKQIQLRAQTRGYLIAGAEADQIWATVNPRTLRDYASIAAPGTPSEQPDGHYPNPNDRTVVEQARKNFGVLDCVVTEMEVLQLHREGHRRVRFWWEEGAQAWKGQWLVP